MTSIGEGVVSFAAARWRLWDDESIGGWRRRAGGVTVCVCVCVSMAMASNDLSGTL